MTRRKALLLIIILIAAALRFYALGAKSLWLDEISSVRRVRGSFREMIAEVALHDGHPPLYYALQYGAKVLGGGEATVRIPSALAGIALVYVAYRIARKLFDETAGLLAAGLCAVSAFQIYFSQEARPYTLAMLLAALSFLLFLRILEGEKVFEGGSGETVSKKFPPTTLHWITYTLVAAAMLYTYYYLAFALLAEGIILLFSYRRAGPIFKKWLASRAVAAVLFAPYVPVVLGRMSGLPGAPAQSSWDILAAIPSAFVRMLTGIDLTWLQPGAALTAVIYLAAFVPVGAALFMLRKNRFALVAALTYILVPVVAVVVLPWRLQIFEAKHLAFVSPVLLILGTYAAARCTCRPPAWLAVGLLVFLNAFALSEYYGPQFQKEQWPQACSVIADNARDGDGIFFNPYQLGYPYDFYYSEALRPMSIILVLHPQPDKALAQLKQAAAELKMAIAKFDRVWVVTEIDSNVAIRYPAQVSDVIRKTLAPASFHSAGGEIYQAEFPGHKGTIVVRLYAR